MQVNYNKLQQARAEMCVAQTVDCVKRLSGLQGLRSMTPVFPQLRPLPRADLSFRQPQPLASVADLPPARLQNSVKQMFRRAEERSAK